MLTFIVIILYLAVILFDFIPVIKSGDKKICWVYSVFMAVSFCVLILYTFDIMVPSPSGLIKHLVEIFYKP
nr:hypothetical protein [uncultured Caproiciproducens sp.]